MTATAHQVPATPSADVAGDGGGPATVASPVANAWEMLARERKARAIATTLMRVLPRLTADDAAALDAKGRRAAAMLARVRPCSDEAWSMVVDELRRCGR